MKPFKENFTVELLVPDYILDQRLREESVGCAREVLKKIQILTDMIESLESESKKSIATKQLKLMSENALIHLRALLYSVAQSPPDYGFFKERPTDDEFQQGKIQKYKLIAKAAQGVSDLIEDPYNNQTHNKLIRSVDNMQSRQGAWGSAKCNLLGFCGAALMLVGVVSLVVAAVYAPPLVLAAIAIIKVGMFFLEEACSAYHSDPYFWNSGRENFHAEQVKESINTMLSIFKPRNKKIVPSNYNNDISTVAYRAH